MGSSESSPEAVVQPVFANRAAGAGWRAGAGAAEDNRQPQHYFGAGGSHRLSFSAVGKFSGTFWVTWPVAAHSVPRSRVVTKPTSFIETTS